ncbi:MAG: DNA polymerase, partial [Candidatus Omnitrophica bacterium]|nr:DNA polymerase [Candidatus Omnitrophota bacterium]
HNIDKIKNPKIRNAIKENLKVIELNQKLLKLNSRVPIDFSLERLKVKEPDYFSLYRVFNKLEFKSLLKELPVKDNYGFSDMEDRVKLDLSSLKDSLGEEVIVFCNYDSSEIIFLHPDGRRFSLVSIEEAKGLLEDGRIKKIGYDFKRLIHFLNMKGVKVNNIFFDIMIAGYLLEPSETDYTLESLAFRYLSIILKQPSLFIYVQVVLRLYLLFREELIKKSLNELFYLTEMPLIEVLVDIEKNGIRFDEDFLKKLLVETEKNLEDIKRKIFLEAGEEFNVNSSKQLRYILFEKLKLTPLKRKRTGPSTDEEVLRVLSEKNRLASLILDYRQLMK